jgi:hypothetical protein
MLSFYYSAQNINDFQKNPAESIGGYISLNQFESGELNNIFNDFVKIKNENKNKCFLLVIKNNNVSKTNFRIFSEILQGSEIFNIKLSVVEPAYDGENYYFERLSKNTNKPIYANFAINNSTNKINVGTLTANKIYGLWIMRETKNTELNTEIDSEKVLDNTENKNLVISTILNKTNDFNIVFEYD